MNIVSILSVLWVFSSTPGAASQTPAPSPTPTPTPTATTPTDPVASTTPASTSRPEAPTWQMLPTRATVVHIAKSQAPPGKDFPIVAVIDAAWTESELAVYYRPTGFSGEFAQTAFERSTAGGYFAVIPKTAMEPPGVEYYIAGQTLDGTDILHFASAEIPHTVQVRPTRIERWKENERRRLTGRVDTVRAEFFRQNFGNRYKLDDDFNRSEITWKHRYLGTLYSTAFGFGFIQGETPSQSGPAAESVTRGVRYGFGEVGMMLHPSVWLDGRGMIGFSHDGFSAGFSGILTLGKPWRACVNIGIESIIDIGPSFTLRLQWDTVPGFLMGAAIVKTNIPDAFTTNGAYLVYDISREFAERFRIGGKLSFGSRDGPANFGAGLSSEVKF